MQKNLQSERMPKNRSINYLSNDKSTVVTRIWSMFICYLCFRIVHCQKICQNQNFPIGILINRQANASDTNRFIQLAIDRFNCDLKANATNSTIIQIRPYVQIVNDTNPINVIDAIGKLIERKVVALISSLEGPLHRIVLSYSNVYQLPLIHTDQNENSLYVPGWYQLSIKPQYLNALAAIIQHFNWKNIIYLYNTEDGLAKLQTLFNILIKKKFEWKLDKIKSFTTAQSAHDYIESLEFNDKEMRKFVLLDCDANLAREIIIKHVNNIYLGRRNFHFLFASLIIDDYWFRTTKEFGAINITGLRVLNPHGHESREIFSKLNLVTNGDKLMPLANQLTLEIALVYDSLAAIYYAIKDLVYRDEGLITNAPNEYLMLNEDNLECKNIFLANRNSSGRNSGQLLHKFLRYVKFDGFTGQVEFSGLTYRQNFKINIVQMTTSSEMTEYATYIEKDNYPEKESHLVVIPSKLHRQNVRRRSERRHVIITSILEEPYLMWRKGDLSQYEGNEKFEGYCKDLADILMSSMNLTYTLKLVNDSKYGAEDSRSKLGWNGMIGELLRKEADLAIAPLTITSARERVVDFTKPFMSTGISIMIKRPKLKYSDVFSFLNPLSKDIWYCVAASYLAVSLVIFVVGKCSQGEWQKGSIGVYQDRKFSEDFTLFNCFWFALGSILRQNSEISPRSFPARIAGGVWWFFTLILVSSYTANLAAFLTVERMVVPIQSADDLSKQTYIDYGLLRDSSTQEFFRNSKVQVYKRMYDHMVSRPHVLMDSYSNAIDRVRNSEGRYAFLIESTKNEYINSRQPCDTIRVGRNLDTKGYGIASPIGSALTIEINLKILQLKELSELQTLEQKWWIERSECKSIDSKNININQNSLSLTNVTGCFYILAFGIILSFFVSIFEYYSFQNNNQLKKLCSKRSLNKSNSISHLKCPVHDHDQIQEIT